MGYYYMDNETYKALSRVRIERAKELLDEAEDLLQKGNEKLGVAMNTVYAYETTTFTGLLVDKNV